MLSTLLTPFIGACNEECVLATRSEAQRHARDAGGAIGREKRGVVSAAHEEEDKTCKEAVRRCADVLRGMKR